MPLWRGTPGDATEGAADPPRLAVRVGAGQCPALLPVFGKGLDFFEEPEVGLVPIFHDRAADHRSYCAAWLGLVATIRKPAIIDVLHEIRKTPHQLLGVESPEADLAETRCVDQVTTFLQRNHLRGDGRVPAAADLLADLARPEAEPRLERVQKA